MIPITEDLIPAGNKNRPAILLQPKKIIIHRTGNRNAPLDMENRNYWVTDPGWHSAHYLVDDKTILRCLPENEEGYHCIGANHDSIGIETCEPLTAATYQNVLDLIVDIMLRHEFKPTVDYLQPHSKYDDINRRFDPFRWIDYEAGKCNQGTDLFNPFAFYADVKSQFLRKGGKLS